MQNCSINKARVMDLKKVMQMAGQTANKTSNKNATSWADTNNQTSRGGHGGSKDSASGGGSTSKFYPKDQNDSMKSRQKSGTATTSSNSATKFERGTGQFNKGKSKNKENSSNCQKLKHKDSSTENKEASLKKLNIKKSKGNNPNVINSNQSNTASNGVNNPSSDTIKSLRKISSISSIDQQNLQNPNQQQTPLAAISSNNCTSSNSVNGCNGKCQVSKVLQQQPKLNLKDFQLGMKLGKGRFGNVYLAMHKLTKFSLAIKIVNKKQLKKSDMQNQLISEIKLQTYLNHPNILKMYGVFSDALNIYLLLELGGSCLFKQLRKKKQFTQEQAAYYIKQTIQSLKYIHSENIIHRDIKPENILISEGVVKLSDFGWSIYSPLYKRQTFCGTLDYVPPQIVQGQYYDERADIWSLGVLCYELATGHAPFQSKTDKKQTYDKILSGQLKFPQQMSQQLRDLITRILKKQPKQRLNLIQIQNHLWLKKHSTVGRHISKQIWQAWQNFK